MNIYESALCFLQVVEAEVDVDGLVAAERGEARRRVNPMYMYIYIYIYIYIYLHTYAYVYICV